MMTSAFDLQNISDRSDRSSMNVSTVSREKLETTAAARGGRRKSSVFLLDAQEEVIGLQAKLNKRNIAKLLSFMYGVLVVSISFTFVVATLWIDDYTRFTLDVMSAILILPGLAFIIFCSFSMYEKRTANSGQAHHSNHADTLNIFLKVALVFFTCGAILQHIFLLIDFHTDPHYFSNYPEIYVAKAQLHQQQNHATTNSQKFTISSSASPLGVTHIDRQVFIQNVFWHVYIALCIVIEIVTTWFIINLSRFRFSRHRLISCIGLVHLCALNGYLWLYLVALETKHDLDEHQAAQHVGGEHNVDQLVVKVENVSMSFMDRLKQLAENQRNVKLFDDVEHTVDDSWSRKVMSQTKRESTIKDLAEFFFPFIPEMIIINITTFLVNWIVTTRNTPASIPLLPTSSAQPLQSLRPSTACAQLVLKTRQQIIELREPDSKTDWQTFWYSLKTQTIGSWLLLGASVVLVLFTLVFGIIPPYIFGRNEVQTEVQRILPLMFRISLHLYVILASLHAWYHLHKMTRVRKYSVGEYLDRALLVACVTGIYAFATWSMIGVLYAKSSFEGTLNATDAVLLIIEVTIQLMLIIDASKRRRVYWKRTSSHSASDHNFNYRHDMEKERQHMPGRGSLGFLVLVNNAFWMINVFNTLRTSEYPLEVAYYGAIGWSIICHLTVPLMVLFRFHASVMLFEIWLNLNRFVVPVLTGQATTTVATEL